MDSRLGELPPRRVKVRLIFQADGFALEGLRADGFRIKVFTAVPFGLMDS